MEYGLTTMAPIFLFPFGAFVINAFLGRKLPRQGDWVAIAGIFTSFCLMLRHFKHFILDTHLPHYKEHFTFTWIDLGNFKIPMGVLLDNLSIVTLTMVTGVAFLIFLFSSFYMKGDSRYGKFFTLLSLFTSAMIGMVLSDNLIGMFCFWEVMGFCSYSLIGFYTEKEKASQASLKAFMTTRVGDVCFLLGILAIWSVIGTVSIPELYAQIQNGAFAQASIWGIPMASFAAVCLFMGTVGKSAQFPLQVWLPDAMMGPTPCSALIHAATMVAAGVYLSLRLFPLMELGGILPFIATIGAITAFGAATMALVQTDIKGVLAFSTISQLGYMVLGIGVGAYNPAFMHLITHAIFKACLFLAAGSVIHSLHDHHTHEHVQEMPRMGGLRKKLPFTFFAMMCCSLAIAGVPLFSGFVSKDRILGDALFWAMKDGGFSWKWIVPVLGFSAAFMTAYYMFRMMFLTFFGHPRDEEVYHHCHEEHLQFNRNIPLLILSVLTLGVFYSGTLTGQPFVALFPAGGVEWFSRLIVLPASIHVEHLSEHLHHLQHSAHVYGAIGSVIIAALGIFLAYLMHHSKTIDANKIYQQFKCAHRWLINRYYFDHLYVDILIQKGLMRWNNALAYLDLGIYDRFAIDGWSNIILGLSRFKAWFDDMVVDGIVDAFGVLVRLLNVFLRTLQSGKVQLYMMVMVIGASILIVLTGSWV